MQFPSFKEHKAHDSLLLRFDAISRNCARFLSQNAPMLVQFNIDAISLPLCATAWTAQMGPDIPGYFYVTCNFFFVIRPFIYSASSSFNCNQGQRWFLSRRKREFSFSTFGECDRNLARDKYSHWDDRKKL